MTEQHCMETYTLDKSRSAAADSVFLTLPARPVIRNSSPVL